MSGPIQHLVLFNFPRALSEEEEGEMFGRVRAWPERIGEFRRLRFGRDASGRSRGYDFALMVEFETAEDMERYLPHAVHRAFADWVHARGSHEVVVDYPVTPDTVIVGGLTVAGPRPGASLAFARPIKAVTVRSAQMS